MGTGEGLWGTVGTAGGAIGHLRGCGALYRAPGGAMGHGAGRFRGRQDTVGQVRGLGCMWAGLGHPEVQRGHHGSWLDYGAVVMVPGPGQWVCGVPRTWLRVEPLVTSPTAGQEFREKGCRTGRVWLNCRNHCLFISSYPAYQNETSFISK